MTINLKRRSLSEYFNNKVVVITGGAGGLGFALTELFIHYGANVASIDLNTNNLKPSKQLLPIATDITHEESLNNAIKQIKDHFNGIDLLINNAGITHMSCFSDLSKDVFNQIINVNFLASVNITRLCLPYIRKSKQGQITAISSVAGFAPLYGRSAYSASKHAIEGFFRSLASELTNENINVLVVSPSFVKSRPELKAKVNDGISSPGAMKKSMNGEALSPQVAALEILNAIANEKSILYLGRTSKIARWLFALFPNLYMKIMTKQAKREFE